MLTKISSHFLMQVSFKKKLVGMAAFLLCLFGGLSAYSLGDSYEIRREMEETHYSDLPLLRTTIQSKEHNQSFRHLLEEIRHQHSVHDEEHRTELGKSLHRLHLLCEDIHELTQQGYQQAQTSLDNEYLKEGRIRLNAENEDYQELANLFNQFSSSHQIVELGLHHLESHSYGYHVSSYVGIDELIQDVSKEIENSEATIEQIFNRLDLHMQSSFEVAMHEQKKLQIFSLSLTIMAIASGIFCVVSLIYQLRNSLLPVTNKAKKIAQALGKENYEETTAGLSEAEIARTVTAGKEIAELGLAFNQMVANFAKARQSQLEVEHSLAKEKSFISFALSSINDGVISLDSDGLILTANMAASRLLGCDVASLIGQDFTDLLVQKTSVHWDIVPDSTTDQNQRITLENCYGQSKTLEMSYAPIRLETAEILGSVIVMRDISQMIKAHDQLAWQASHDSLTGLANRRKFLAYLEGLSQCPSDSSTIHSLLYLDLDRFKIVNDTCGHDAGDELLAQVSKHIASEIRSTDLVARIGGDEFGIILKFCPLERAIAVARKILMTVQNFRFYWKDKTFSLGISIGVVAYFPNYDNPQMILKAADQACYNAKSQGRNQVYVVPDASRHLAHKSTEMSWLRIINQALEEDHFQLYQQKIVEVNTCDSVHEHYEVLLRLSSAEGKILSPSSFLPIAERYGLMAKLDRWVISHFFASQGSYLRSLYPPRHADGGSQSFYSLNLSSESLNDPELIPFLKEQFTTHQIPPSVICFEITETVAIANLDHAAQIIKEVKSLGCRFALDDFGSGMSSFGYLQKLPIDFLKIDGQFVEQLCQNSMNDIIVTALHQVAQAINIKTIAEFVDNEATLQRLREIGIDYAQGYYIDKPKPLPRMQLLKSQNKALSQVVTSS